MTFNMTKFIVNNLSFTAKQIKQLEKQRTQLKPRSFVGIAVFQTVHRIFESKQCFKLSSRSVDKREGSHFESRNQDVSQSRIFVRCLFGRCWFVSMSCWLQKFPVKSRYAFQNMFLLLLVLILMALVSS